MFGFLRRKQSRTGTLADAYHNTLIVLEFALDRGIKWRRRAAAAEQLLGRALTYLDHTPLEGVMDVADDIRQHYIKMEKQDEENEKHSVLPLGIFGREKTS